MSGKIYVLGRAAPSYEKETAALLAWEPHYEQEDRACSLDDGDKQTITITPAPQGTIPQLWTSSGTYSCGSRRFANSTEIPAAETLLLRRISETYWGCFSIETVTAINAECPAPYLSTDGNGSFNDTLPIPFLRLRAAESGSVATRVFLAAGMKTMGLLGIAWRACRDGFPVAPVGGEVSVSPA